MNEHASLAPPDSLRADKCKHVWAPFEACSTCGLERAHPAASSESGSTERVWIGNQSEGGYVTLPVTPQVRSESVETRIAVWLDGTKGDGKGGRRELPGDLLRDCLAALTAERRARESVEADVDRLLELSSTPDHHWEERDYADHRAIQERFRIRVARASDGDGGGEGS